jgi:hypothetical protein
MKIAIPLAAALALSVPAFADVTIQPGQVQTFAHADGCFTDTEIPNAVEELAGTHVACDAAGRRVKAEVIPIVGAGWVGFQTVKGRAALHNDFTLGSTPETAENTVGAWVTYDVNYNGLMAFIGFLSNPTVELKMMLHDLTENKKIKGEMVWSRDGQGIGVSIPEVPLNFNIGGGVDAHSVTNTFSTVLRRGHTYRLTLELTCSVFSDGGLDIGSECDYMNDYIGGDGGGAGWTRLEVKAGIDEAELMQKLNQLTNHTHTYLTGQGVGHNNTEAETGPPHEDEIAPPEPVPENPPHGPKKPRPR